MKWYLIVVVSSILKNKEFWPRSNKTEAADSGLVIATRGDWLVRCRGVKFWLLGKFQGWIWFRRKVLSVGKLPWPFQVWWDSWYHFCLFWNNLYWPSGLQVKLTSSSKSLFFEVTHHVYHLWQSPHSPSLLPCLVSLLILRASCAFPRIAFICPPSCQPMVKSLVSRPWLQAGITFKTFYIPACWMASTCWHAVRNRVASLMRTSFLKSRFLHSFLFYSLMTFYYWSLPLHRRKLRACGAVTVCHRVLFWLLWAVPMRQVPPPRRWKILT